VSSGERHADEFAPSAHCGTGVSPRQILRSQETRSGLLSDLEVDGAAQVPGIA
jgi:hypothetical protein